MILWYLVWCWYFFWLLILLVKIRVFLIRCWKNNLILDDWNIISLTALCLVLGFWMKMGILCIILNWGSIWRKIILGLRLIVWRRRINLGIWINLHPNLLCLGEDWNLCLMIFRNILNLILMMMIWHSIHKFGKINLKEGKKLKKKHRLRGWENYKKKGWESWDKNSRLRCREEEDKCNKIWMKDNKYNLEI